MRAAKGRPYREGEIFWDGRVRTPAPTKFGESSGFSVGADDLGGPRAHSVRPYTEKKGRTVNVLWERESPRRFAAPPFDKGGFGRKGISGGLFLALRAAF